MSTSKGSSDPLQELAAVLRELHLAAGKPSTRAVAAASGSISHDSVHRVLTCDRTGRTPRWPTVRAVAEALGGDVDRVRSLWTAAAVQAEESPAEHVRRKPVLADRRRVRRARPTDTAPRTTAEDVLALQTESGGIASANVRSGSGQGLSEDSLRWFRENGQQRRYAPGNAVAVQGDSCHAVFVIVKGWMRSLQHSSLGASRLVSFHGSGELLAAEAAVLDDVQLYSVAAVDEAIVTIVPVKRFTERFASDPVLARDVGLALASRLRRQSALHTDTTAVTSLQRVAMTVADLVRDYAVSNVPDGASSTQWTLPFPLSQSELGSLAGVSLVSVHRALRGLRERGVLTMGYRRLTVTDLAGLWAIAEGLWPSTSGTVSFGPR